MGNFYSDQKFGVIQRRWFGLTKKWGGDVAAGFTLGAEAATKTVHLAAFYPKGPIKVLKVGAMVLATPTSTATTVDRQPCFFTKTGVRVSAAFNLARNAVQHTIASAVPTEATVSAAGYIGFQTGTPETDKGTDVTTGTMAGTLAFFMDYIPTFTADGKWDT